MTFILAVVVGLIGGAAAVLPVSGSAHTAIIAGLFGLKGSPEDFMLMSLFVEAGALAAIIIAYRKYIREILRTVKMTFSGEGQSAPKRTRRSIGLICAASIPLILGIAFRRQVALLYNNYLFIGIALIGTGLVILSSEKYMDEGAMKEGTFSPGSALITGFGQLVAMLPGFSRIAAVIAFTKSRGGESGFAYRFALILGVPAIVGCLIGDLIGTIGTAVNRKLIPVYLVGTLFAACSSFVAINLGRRAYKKGTFIYFAYYSFPLGVVTVIAGLLFKS